MIYWLNKIDDKDLNEVGFKALNLSKVFSTALNVPIGFVVPSSVYRSFIEKLKLDDVVDRIDVNDPEKLKFNARKIQLLIMRSQLNNEDIVDAYDTLSADNLSKKVKPFVSLRLSPSTADESVTSLLDASFHNIKGSVDVVEHVKACYASVFTAKNIYYLKKNNYDWRSISLPLIIQLTVDAVASGVAYCKNPSTDADEIVVEAVFGLGKGLELVSPDVYVVDKESNDIKEINVGEKTVSFVRDKVSGKTISKSLSGDRVSSQVLDDKFIDEIARIAKRVEKVFLSPQRVEWAFDGKKFFVLGSFGMK